MYGFSWERLFGHIMCLVQPVLRLKTVFLRFFLNFCTSMNYISPINVLPMGLHIHYDILGVKLYRCIYLSSFMKFRFLPKILSVIYVFTGFIIVAWTHLNNHEFNQGLRALNPSEYEIITVYNYNFLNFHMC